MTGYIDSIETMGLVDGPGIRMVVFMQGCHLRCLFCHNPETWNINKKENSITSDELVAKVKRNLSYYKNGGITFSGGEPLIQTKFMLDVLKKLKAEGVHVALDTAGVGDGSYEEILKYVDLIILDVKAIDEQDYEKMTFHKMDEFKKFVTELNKSNCKVWLRQVIVPGINDTKENILKLNEFSKTIKNVEKVELLPYHLYGVEKYKKLNIPYKLEGVEALSNDKLNELKSYLK